MSVRRISPLIVIACLFASAQRQLPAEPSAAAHSTFLPSAAVVSATRCRLSPGDPCCQYNLAFCQAEEGYRIVMQAVQQVTGKDKAASSSSSKESKEPVPTHQLELAAALFAASRASFISLLTSKYPALFQKLAKGKEMQAAATDASRKAEAEAFIAAVKNEIAAKGLPLTAVEKLEFWVKQISGLIPQALQLLEAAKAREARGAAAAEERKRLLQERAAAKVAREAAEKAAAEEARLKAQERGECNTQASKHG